MNPKALWNREPALILAFIQAVLGLLIVFGLAVTAEQAGAIMAVSAAGVGLIVRRQVTPT